MDTLEDRNLNRLRNGKMMLEYSKVKKSWSIAFVLALLFPMFGAHRFYLGQWKIGLLIVIAFLICAASAATSSASDVNGVASITSLAFMVWTVVEMVITPWLTSRHNERLKSDLKLKHNVLDYR